jgi:LacI family gluconate utilization system Gnt-I transcriptional repressor
MPLEMISGAELLKRARQDFPDVDAIMFSSDILASGALLESARLGIAVPQALAITGFGDFELSRHLNPSLTTVSAPSAQIGREAGRLLLEGMRGTASSQKRLDVGFKLMLRDSG